MNPNNSNSAYGSGILFGLVAYGLWGVVPIYWKQWAGISSVEVLAHRVLWSLAIAVVLLWWTKGTALYGELLRSPRHLLPVAAASALLALNWLVFIYAVQSGQVLATSLGYYLNPLLNVVLGMLVLGERLRPLQFIAVAFATAGVGYHIYSLGELPWIAAVLASSFCIYGLLRKTTPVEPIVGFGIEMTVLSVPGAIYIAYLFATGTATVPNGELRLALLLPFSGVLTAAPLICFNFAAKRLTYITVGILQYIAPTITLLLAVLWYGEDFGTAQRVTFALVWVALAIFTAEALWFYRQNRAAA